MTANGKGRYATVGHRNDKIRFQIGNTAFTYGVMLAPMAGVTDATYRAICMEQGAEWCVSEMISAKAMWYHDKKTAALAALSEGEMPCAVQIFGSEPEVMAYAARALSAPDTPCTRIPAAIDINMGCPMPKIANNGDGAALMRDPVLAGRIIEAVRAATDLPVTVKMRLGWDGAHKNCAELARIAAALGVSMICVHGRTRAQLYTPGVDRAMIRAVREAVDEKIPVIANGDIFSGEDAVSMLSETGCNGVMVGRGANGNPWIFSEIRAAMDGVPYTPPTANDRIDMAILHLERLLAHKGGFVGVQEGRKHLAWYTKGIAGAASVRDKIMKTEDAHDVKALLLQMKA